MLRKLSPILLVFCIMCAGFLSGCDEAAVLEVTFNMPDSDMIMGREITGYKIQVIDPVTTDVIVEVEGVPGEVIVQTVVIPCEYVLVNVVAFSYADVVVEVDDQVDVLVGVHSGCEVVVDVNVVVETGATTVDVMVDCPGADVSVDVDVPMPSPEDE